MINGSRYAAIGVRGVLACWRPQRDKLPARRAGTLAKRSTQRGLRPQPETYPLAKALRTPRRQDCDVLTLCDPRAFARNSIRCICQAYIILARKFAQEDKTSTSGNAGSDVSFLRCSVWRVITTAVGEGKPDVGRAGDVQPEQGRSRRAKSDGRENREKSRDLPMQKETACVSAFMRTV